MLQKTVDFKDDEIPQSMIDFLLENMKNKDNEINGQFIYKESQVLRTFIAKLYAASIIHLPVCVYGPTGVGKTSAAEQFSRERSSKGYQKHSFHAGTKPNHFYATTTIQDKKISLKYGSLTTAMIKGQVFIADEMNLSSLTNMKSLAPALEPCIGKDVFIPGVGETISIDPDYFFIACQNELGTLGRNAIPSSIASRFRYFNYPELKDDEIADLCILKRMVLYDKKDQENKFNDETFIKDSRNLGRFMIALNNLKQRIIPKWSFRDITKIFLRVYQQDASPYKYRNISFYHQVLFFSISAANEEDSKLMIEQICDLMQEKFELSTNQRNEIFNCYISDPEIDGRFIMKGKSGVLATECSINSPAPLLNALFITKLSHENEPIIFMGSSGYKTYLAKKLLKNAKVITLNQESTNAQLLGKSYPFTKTESKLFYLDTLTKILNISHDIIYDLKEKLKNNDLKFEDFILIIASIPSEKQNNMFDDIQTGKISLDDFLEKVFDLHLKISLPESFKYAFINLTKKLFTDFDTDNNSIISNFVFEFKPGLFLSSILEGKSLILKNLSNLPTIVFERFNELFSGEHSLTLQEDINNTFTKENTNRKLSKFNDVFRVFGTCPPNSFTKLSEAVLSRFTVIYTHQYQPKDQKKVLYFLDNLKADQSFIDYVINFSEQLKNEQSIKKSITFIQMINIVEMHSKLVLSQKSIDQKDLLATVLYRIVLGILEKRDRMKGKLREKINNVFYEIGIPLRHELTSPFNENPLYVTTENGIKIVKSKITNIAIESPTAHEIENNNCTFTKLFVEMVETIYLGLASNTPIILEGTPGQGKQTAIKYVADTLGYDVINIMISQSTKADDLLGKLNISYDNNHNIRVEIIKTKLVEAIESESKAKSSIIVFHNINHATSAVLEVIQTIFDPHESNICLTNGSLIPKRKLNLIGIYNVQNGYSNRSNLPSSLIYSSLYYIVNNPTKDELQNVIRTLFKNTEFQDEWTSFYSSFNLTNKIAKDNNATSILTLNDVVKYIIFRKATFSKIDKDIIAQMIFAYRFINEETIKEVKKQINVKDMNFSPSFTYDTGKTILNINVKNEESQEFQEGINIDLFSNKIDDEEIESRISCLTLPQKHCLLFLACSVLSKRSCILQGATSSGKSHIIRLFAKMLGQELIVYQMNKDTGISILTGQPLLSSTLSNEDIDNITLWLENISIIPKFKEYIKDNFSENPKEWKLIDFQYFLDYIDENKEIISENNKDFINNTVIEIKKIIRHEKRFTHQESEFIKAMKEGKWVLIDGIESAPPEIAQKISSLCGDDPELHLIESGKDNYFSRKPKENAQPINDNFHLFVTFNPSSQKENIYLDPTFFNKCVSFTLPPIDSAPEYSAQILHGSLLKMSYPNDIAIEISARMSMSHKVAKNESINNNDVFAGDLQFTGRTLKFITTEFQLHSAEESEISKDIYVPVCNSFHSFYWNSEMKNNEKLSQNEGKLKKDMVDAFSKTADYDIVTSLNQKSDNPKVRNIDVLMVLRSIQLLACKLVEKSDFSFEFIQKCRKTKLSDVPFIIKHIEDTISIIDKNAMYSDEVYQFEFHQLYIILNILKEINNLIPIVGNELKDARLDNFDLLTVDQKLEFCLLKLQLLEKLQNDDFSLINPKTPNLFYNQNLFNLFQIIIDMSQNQTIDHFNQFISIIAKDQKLIPLIESIFPYNLFINTPFETMNYWMPMFLNLYNKKITFHVKIDEDEYDFINEESRFEPTYVFSKNNLNETLLLYPGTRLKIHSSNKDSKMKHSHEKHHKPHNDKPNINYDDLLRKNYEAYGATQFILSSNNVDESKLEAEKKKYTTKIPYPKAYQKSKFMLLLPKNAPKRSMVSNIWSLIFSMPQDSSEIWFKYLHPLEVDIFKCLSQFLQLLNKKNINGIISLTKWMNNYDNVPFGDERSYLWKFFDKSLIMNIKMNESKIREEIDIIQNEKDYLNSYPKISGWSTESYINLLNNEILFVYQQKLNEIISSNKERLIKNQLTQLLQKVKETKPNKTGHKNFKESFISALQKIINNNNPTEKLLEKCQMNFDDFIKVISKNDSNYSKESFNWPFIPIKTNQQNQNSKTIKLYQHILWYSQAFAVIERIIKQSDTVKNISDLCEIPDMKGISSYLINKICKNSNISEKKIDNRDISILQSNLNAHFICKLINDDLIDQIGNLDTILNNLEDRRSENSEVIWINQNASKYPIDLQIVLPHFIPNDIFSLFVCYENDSIPSCGPYLKNNQMVDQTLANSLAAYLQKKTKKDKTKFKKYSVLVCIEIYNNKISKSLDLPNDFDDFESIIKKDLESYKSDKFKVNVLTKIFSILQIGKSLSICPQFQFSFNDTLFLDKNWINDEEFVNKYPSLLYWLSLNGNCRDQLRYNFSNYEFSNQKLPFWLFAVRIMSSLQCIEFYCQNQSIIAQLIKNTINRSILSFFKKSDSTKLYGTKWINFLLPHVPSELLNNNYKMLYQYFINLSQDDAPNIKLLWDKKEKAIELFSEKVTSMVFNDEIDDFLNMPFDKKDENESLKFVIDPQLQINQEINDHLNMLFSNFMNDDNFIQLKICSSNIHNDINNFITKLQEYAISETKSFDSEFIYIKDEKNSKIKNKIYNLINDYNSLLNELMSNYITVKDSIKRIYRLYNITQNKYILYMKQDETKPCLQINCISYEYYEHKNMQINFQDNKFEPYYFRNIPEEHALYFRDSDFSLEDLKNSELIVKHKKHKKIIQKKVDTEFYYPYSIDENEIQAICENELCKPHLLFGDRYNLNEYINLLSEEIIIITSSIDEIENDIAKSTINIETINRLNQINDKITYLIKILNVKYSNGQQRNLSNIQHHLDEQKGKLTQIKTYINNLNQYISRQNIQDINLLSNNRKNIFSYKYGLSFPSKEANDIDKSIFSISFDNNNFSSSPFLSLDDDNDSISCCFDIIECTIGPLIPSLYSGNVTINFISFIDNPIKIDIITKDDQYQTWFYSGTYQPKDIAKVFISLPNSTLENNESFDIEADLIISSPGLNTLQLPSIFHIAIAPQIIYISCDKYQIAFKNNCFYLCTDKLLSNEELNIMIHNHNINEPLNYKLQFESLEDNTSAKPIKNANSRDNLNIIIPRVEKPARLHCAINLKFSENLQARLIIDSIIIPFNFSFSLYDYTEKRYVSDSSIILYSNQYFDRQIVLHCKISSPIFELLKDKSVTLKGQIYPKFIQEIQIAKIEINETFTIEKETDFDIYLSYKSQLPNGKDNYISVNINNIEKRIKIVFRYPEPIFKDRKINPVNVFKHDFYQELNITNGLIKIDKSTEFNNIYAICSPFNSYQIKQAQIKYSGDCSIINSKDNIFVYLSEDGEISIKKDVKIHNDGFIKRIVKSKITVPILGINQNEWYPVFDVYSTSLRQQKILEITKENNENAMKLCKQFNFSFNLSNFSKFASLIFMNDQMIHSIKNIINHEKLQCFKDNLPNSNQILSYIDNYESCEKELKAVYSYNLIKELHDSFLRRFSDLQSNKFLLKSNFSEEELHALSNDLYEKYCIIDNDALRQNKYQFSQEIEKLLQSISSINCNDMPPKEEQNEAYLLGNNIIPIEKNIKPEILTISSKGHNSLSKSIIVHLPEITLPDISNCDELSIVKMNDFYQTCLKGTRILPIFIKNIATNKTDENINQAFEYLVLLYRTFKNLQYPDKSIISQSVDEFRNSFCTMIGKFSKAGMNVSKFIPQRFINYNETNQDFISYPTQNEIFIPQDSWNEKVAQSESSIAFPQILSDIDKLHFGEIETFDEEPQLFDDEKKLDKELHVTNSEIKIAKQNEIQVSIIETTAPNNDDYEEEDSYDDIELDDADRTFENSNKVHVTLDKESIEISNENLDGLISNFSEKDSIKASIARMNEINELSNIITPSPTQ